MKLETIFKRCCDSLSVTEEQVKSELRNRKYVMARHLYMYFAEKHTYFSYECISEVVNRDRSSVYHAMDKFKDLEFCSSEENFHYQKILSSIKKYKSFTNDKEKLNKEIKAKRDLIESIELEIDELLKAFI